MAGELIEDIQAMERIAYHLYVRGFLSLVEIKGLIRDGCITYLNRYLYDPLEKEWNILSTSGGARKRKGWEYDDWEKDYSSKNRVLSEFLEIFEARTGEDDPGEGYSSSSAKPIVADAALLQRRFRGRLDAVNDTLTGALDAVVPGKKGWREAARDFIHLEDDEIYERVAALVAKGQDKKGKGKGGFRLLWDLLEYDGYVFDDLVGPVISAYKRVLKGQLVEQLGDHKWILTQPEMRDVYLLVQSQAGLARAFGKMIAGDPDLFGQGLATDFHSLAFRAGALYNASLRWRDRSHCLPQGDEGAPTWIDIFELATPGAFAVASLMDDVTVRSFLMHVFRVTMEKHHSLAQLFLRVLYDHSVVFDRDIEKRDFLEDMRKRVLSDSDDTVADLEIVVLQHEAGRADPYWGPFFKTLPPDKWRRFMRIWWDALAYDCDGEGALWLVPESRWSRRIIGYEAYVDSEQFQESVDFVLDYFYALYCPRVWEAGV
jgi:hypothetical protein